MIVTARDNASRDNRNNLRKTTNMTTFLAATQRTFGVEIEGCNLTLTEAREAVAENPMLAGWRVVADGTSGVTFEAVSPVLKQDAMGFASVRMMCDCLNDAGAEVNVKCGLHVHIGADDLTPQELANVVNRYNFFSESIDAIVSPSRRGNRNHFCTDNTRPVEALESNTRTAENSTHGRYRKMNLKSYLTHGTVENRHHQGTLNASKILNWVKFVAYQVQQAKEDASNSAPALAPTRVARAFNMRGNAAKILRRLEQGTATGQELVEVLGSTISSVHSTVSRMRTRGVNIKTTSGVYRLVSEETSETQQQVTEHTDLAAGMPEKSMEYFRRRMRTLNTQTSRTRRTEFSLTR